MVLTLQLKLLNLTRTISDRWTVTKKFRYFIFRYIKSNLEYQDEQFWNGFEDVIQKDNLLEVENTLRDWLGLDHSDLSLEFPPDVLKERVKKARAKKESLLNHAGVCPKKYGGFVEMFPHIFKA